MAFPGDRRSIRLACTEKAQPVIEKGRNVIRNFYSALTVGMGEEDMSRFQNDPDLIGENIVELKASLKKGEISHV